MDTSPFNFDDDTDIDSQSGDPFEIQEPVGAPSAAPVDYSGAKSRKSVYMIGGAVGVLALVIIFAIRHAKADKPAITESPDSSGVAKASTAAPSSVEDLAQEARALTPQQTTQPKDSLVVPKADSSDVWSQIAASTPAQQTATPAANPLPSAPPPGVEPGRRSNVGQPNEPAPESADVPGEYTDTAYLAKRAADIDRQAAREAREQRKAAIREKLSAAGTMVFSRSRGGEGDSVAIAAPSRFSDTGPTRPRDAQGVLSMLGMGSAGGGNGNPNVLPGSRAAAVTVTEFNSESGSDIVEVQLTAALRSKSGDVLLPAGTKAYGTASAQKAGVQAYAQIQLTTFVTPKGEVIRDISAQAADPRTMSMGVRASTDQKLASRILRGAAATAVDVAISSRSDTRRSVFETESLKDRALADARDRANNITSEVVGDESSDKASVKLPANTQIILIFGLK